MPTPKEEKWKMKRIGFFNNNMFVSSYYASLGKTSTLYLYPINKKLLTFWNMSSGIYDFAKSSP